MIFYGSSSRATRAEEAGYDPHPDDKLPPAAHLFPALGVDPLTAFAAEVQAYRELSDCCNDCNAYTHHDDAAPSCGAHTICVSCYTTSDFRCSECLRVWREVGE